MTLMQLVRLVLDDAYRAIPKETEQEKDKVIKAGIGALSDAYRNLTDKTARSIDYSDPAIRFAYIYKYTVAHADYIMQIIRGRNELKRLFKRPNVEIACLGGGPGSDLLGVLKYMMQAAVKDTTLTCYIYDKERAWGDSWSDVANTIDVPFRLFPVFAHMDMTDYDTWKSYQRFLRADLFTLSYFLSEVWRYKDKVEPFLNHCMSQMKKDSLVLFVDNNSSQFVEWFDELATSNKLSTVKEVNTTLAFSDDEQKMDLGRYYEKFEWPKRQSDVAYRIMKKV